GLVKLDVIGQQQHIEQRVQLRRFLDIAGLKRQPGRLPEAFRGVVKFNLRLMDVHATPHKTKIQQLADQVQAQARTVEGEDGLLSVTGDTDVPDIYHRL